MMSTQATLAAGFRADRDYHGGAEQLGPTMHRKTNIRGFFTEHISSWLLLLLSLCFHPTVSKATMREDFQNGTSTNHDALCTGTAGSSSLTLIIHTYTVDIHHTHNKTNKQKRCYHRFRSLLSREGLEGVKKRQGRGHHVFRL